MSIRERILRKVFPEVYTQLDVAKKIITDYQSLKDSLIIKDGIVTINGPAGILGDLKDCTIFLTPTVNTELVLSKYELSSMLHVAGSQSLVSQNFFRTQGSKQTIKAILVE